MRRGRGRPSTSCPCRPDATCAPGASTLSPPTEGSQARTAGEGTMRRRWSVGTATVALAAVLVAGWPVPAGADRIRDRQWHVGYLNLARAHELSQGEGITIAVIDTGVDGTHPDLEGNVLPGLDADAVVDGGEPGDGWNDPDGHGTGMAGLIAAHGHGPGNA